MYEQGWKQKEIAETLGVTAGAVSQWIKRGREALRGWIAKGGTLRLDSEQVARLPSFLDQGAEVYGFRERSGHRICPALNPQEGGWNLLKRRELKNVCYQSLRQLRQALLLAKARLRHRRKILQQRFVHALGNV